MRTVLVSTVWMHTQHNIHAHRHAPYDRIRYDERHNKAEKMRQKAIEVNMKRTAKAMIKQVGSTPGKIGDIWAIKE